VQRFQRAPELQAGVGCVQQCGDGRHGSRAEILREVSHVFALKDRRFALRKPGDNFLSDSITPKSFTYLKLACGISDFVTR
jgi:hypothetical protein